jgi:hypothetical protein
MSYKGKFTPQNPEKYKGDYKNIIYRSLWELKVMKYFDQNPNILYWASEELIIPYLSPVDQKMHRYFPDFIAQIKNKNGVIQTYILEVKPYKQTKSPEKKGKNQRKYLNESLTYAINQEKWRAADIFCQKKGWVFKILTENELGLGKTNK